MGTKRFNGPKSVVGPFDKIRRAGKARRVESLIIRGKLKDLTVLRALSVRLIKSDAPAKLAGSNL